MKISSMISGLHNSTKATIIACCVLLAMTAFALFFLMLFPIRAEDKSAVSSAPVIVETTTTETLPVEVFTTTTKEPPHTLSTWEASAETLETTTTADPDGIPWYDKLFTTTVETDKYGHTVTTTATTTTTTTTTIPVTEPPATAPPETAPPETVPPEPEVTIPPTEPITEPPTEPEEEIINAEPIAPEFE